MPKLALGHALDKAMAWPQVLSITPKKAPVQGQGMPLSLAHHP